MLAEECKGCNKKSDLMAMRKRLGIVTWYGTNPNGYNFGTALQSYALQRVLCDMGYDARMFLFKSQGNKGIVKSVLDYIGFLGVLRCARRFMRSGHFFEDGAVRRLRRWNKRHYRETTQEGVSCFVSGSDQIWNTYHHFDPHFFLDFVGNAKRVSYASSIGTRGVNPQCAEKVKGLLSSFNYITAREESGAEALRELTGRSDIRRVQDPTLLMRPDDWRRFGLEENLHQKPEREYLLCYLLSKKSEYIDQVHDVDLRLGLDKIVIVPALENEGFFVDGAVRYVNATPCEFVRLIDEAKFVCTDSFHATVLSMLLSRPFVEFMRFDDGDTHSQNSRIYEILGRYGLMERIYNHDSEKWTESIDYVPIHSAMECDREESLALLRKMIEE